MIEHFKKFDAEDVKSILPLSFSQITDFAFNRERWALRRIFGYEFPSSAAAERGKAVESGLNMILNGMDFDNASKKMHEEFDANVKRFNDPKTQDERDSLQDLLIKGHDSFLEYAFSWNLIGYQKKVELDILGIPLIGYTDFHFEDKNTKEDFYIDLKTSKRKPTGVSMSHAMQQSIYQKGTNATQKLWYLVGKKSGADFYQFAIDDYNTPFKVCEQIVCAMANYLKSVDTLDDVKNTLVPNPDDWIWREEALVKARKEIWGY
tara:strand:+ start:3187 stop:3975 length:789 start_codon:yes stop_codon:yes gene_type:complete